MDEEELLAVQSEGPDATARPGDIAPIPPQDDVRGDHEVIELRSSNHTFLSHDEYSFQALGQASEQPERPDILDMYREDHTLAVPGLLSGLATEPGHFLKVAGHSLVLALQDVLDNYQHRAQAFLNEDVSEGGLKDLGVPQDLEQGNLIVSWAEPRFFSAHLNLGRTSIFF